MALVKCTVWVYGKVSPMNYPTLEDAIGKSLPQGNDPLRRFGPSRAHAWVYRLAIERGYLDAMLLDYVVHPYVSALRWCDTQERRWTDFLSGGTSREATEPKTQFETIEDLL